MTTMVKRVVSSLLGQTDFRNSETVSLRKVTGLMRPPAPGAMDRAPLVETLAMGELPHFPMYHVPAATGAVLAQLHPLGVIAPVLVGGVVAFPAIAALQGYDLTDIRGFSCHLLIQHFGDYA
jgi:hypothetical protein